MGKRNVAVQPGRGDVFTDLGYKDAPERRLRVQLAMKLNEMIAQRGHNQAVTSVLLGISQPHVSELKNYKLNRFSSERLLQFMTRLGRDVQIVIRPKARGHGVGMVSIA